MVYRSIIIRRSFIDEERTRTPVIKKIRRILNKTPDCAIKKIRFPKVKFENENSDTIPTEHSKKTISIPQEVKAASKVKILKDIPKVDLLNHFESPGMRLKLTTMLKKTEKRNKSLDHHRLKKNLKVLTNNYESFKNNKIFKSYDTGPKKIIKSLIAHNYSKKSHQDRENITLHSVNSMIINKLIKT